MIAMCLQPSGPLTLCFCNANGLHIGKLRERVDQVFANRGVVFNNVGAEFHWGNAIKSGEQWGEWYGQLILRKAFFMLTFCTYRSSQEVGQILQFLTTDLAICVAVGAHAAPFHAAPVQHQQLTGHGATCSRNEFQGFSGLHAAHDADERCKNAHG